MDAQVKAETDRQTGMGRCKQPDAYMSETQTRGDREKDRHRERGSEREQHTDKASSRRGPVAHPELEKQTEGSLRHTDVTLPVDWQKYM